MIFGNINQEKTYEFLPEKVKACFKYVKEHDLLNYEKGTHKIDGDNLYVNVAEYTTVKREERFWEAHKAYLDIHILVKGEETIDINFIENMKLGEYKEADDFLPMEGDMQASVTLKPGDFLICYPEDAHRTGVIATKVSDLKKGIFKVKI